MTLAPANKAQAAIDSGLIGACQQVVGRPQALRVAPPAAVLRQAAQPAQAGHRLAQRGVERLAVDRPGQPGVPHRARLGQRLGEIGGADFYISAPQFAYWKHTQLIIDVVPGRGGMFSLENGEGVRFLVRSRLFTDEEFAALSAAGRV